MKEESIGQLIGKAKRIWKESKRIVEYSDEITKEEAFLFKEDTILADLVLEKKEIDKKIVERIDTVLRNVRELKLRHKIEEEVK